jgi:calcium/calmodulin-dependent protein kinase (CaM kinase) II
MNKAPRYRPEIPFPPYAFIPGQNPHPVSDPAGHSFGKGEAKAGLPTFLRAVDLFNHGFYWESHEEWERLWHACGRKGPSADLLKGLIKLAAAGVKHLQGVAKGVQSHARRASELFSLSAATPLFGLNYAELIELAGKISAHGWPPQPPLLVLNQMHPLEEWTMIDPTKELLDLTQKLLDCITNADWTTYQNLCDPTLTCFEPEAPGQLVEGLPFHHYYFELGGIRGRHQTTMANPRVRLMGDVGVVTFTRLIQRVGADGGPATTASTETRVWHRRDGKWLHVHFHRSAFG